MLNKIQTRLFSIQKLREEIASLLQITEEQKKCTVFDAKKLNGRTQKQLRVAAIMDKFTLECFRPECILTELTPSGWQEEIKSTNPDLLFIESAWEGKDKLWHGKINHCTEEVCELTDYCHENNIPVVFWNKEDPVYTDTFMNTARCADVVFTTDMECIQKYKTELGHDRVYHLHFAAQTKTHNPIEKYERQDKFCFAGAYYHRYEQRCKIFDAFSKHFIETRGLDIYDRNYPSPRPEHKFPDFYNPYILGRLEPADIDVAYKGYTFGINMNSVTQSQTMFARRVFELLASNTVVVGNYSRGVKNYFGDLTICTDDEKTLQQALEQFCIDDNTRDRYRLLGLRKVLTEHLCEDRLDEVVQKVYGVSVKPSLAPITVCARVNTEEELKTVRKNFDAQVYENKKLVLITDIKIDTREKEQCYKAETFEKTKLSAICGEGFLAYFSTKDWYGKNYLLDLVLTTRYADYDVIGKAAYFSGDDKEMHHRNAAYRPANSLVARRAIISAKSLTDCTGEQLNYEKVWQISNMFAADGYNYCENSDFCAAASDIQVADRGIAKAEMDRVADSIMPVLDFGTSVTIGANEIADVNIPKNIPLIVESDGKYAKISSDLADGQHHYVYLKKKIPVDSVLEDGKISVMFRGSGSLSLVCGCVFYDEKGTKLDVKYPKLGRREILDVPENASYLMLLYRPREKGTAKLECIELGSKSSVGKYGDCYLLRSNVLILTNHYPSYDNLYRNMFVHKRVKSYKNDGFLCDVMCMNPYANAGFREFEGISVIEGHAEDLSGILATGSIDTVCVHFLDWDMWNVLKGYLSSVRLLIWSHGADIQPWWRREFIYQTAETLEEGKRITETRMKLWKEVFDAAQQSKNQIELIFVSEYFRNMVEEDYKIDLKPISHIIHNMIDTEQFSYIAKSKDDRKKIISVRPYSSTIYGNDISAKAIEILSKKPWFEEMEFTIIGRGELFHKITDPLCKYKNVKVKEIFLRQDEIAEYYHKNGVVLIPTRGDTQGVSRDEAMSSGLVPVTNAVAAIPEFVDDTCGILAQADDAKAIADGIERLYENPELFLEMSQNAAKRVRSQTSKGYTINKELKLIYKVDENSISRE